MPREKKHFRDWLELLNQYPAFMSVADVAQFTGMSERAVTRRFAGWTKEGRGKLLSKINLADQLAAE